jgi:hypothetical protein
MSHLDALDQDPMPYGLKPNPQQKERVCGDRDVSPCGFGMIEVVKNSRVSHCDQKGHHHSIYSLDFQYGGSRLATGGGGTQKSLQFFKILILSRCNCSDLESRFIITTGKL